MKKAFTFIEIMIVIALMTLMLGLSLLYSQTSIVRSDLNSQRSGLISQLRLAQSNAMSGKKGASYGVHIKSDSYTTFTGSSYVADGTGNFIYNLPSTIQLTNLSLNGSGSNVIFTSPKGETSEYGSIDIYSEQIQKTSTITINQFGVVTY